MKITILYSILLLTLVSSPISGQIQAASVTISNKISKQVYCSNHTLELGFIVIFKNTGSVPVLLLKNRQTDSGIIRQIKGRMEENFTMPYSSPFIDYTDQIRAGSLTIKQVELDQFVTLKPGETYSYRSKSDRTIDLYNENEENENALLPGTYTIEQNYSMWEYWPQEIEKYREEWKERGYLWTDTIVSKPMQFKVLSNPPIVKCDDEK